jgi:hypothetical protein
MQSLNLGWLYRIIKWVTTMAYHGIPWHTMVKSLYHYVC